MVKTMGEGLLAAFDRVTAAVTTALALLDQDATSECGPIPSARGWACIEDQPWPSRSTISLTILVRQSGRRLAILDYVHAGELVLDPGSRGRPEVAAAAGDARDRGRCRTGQVRRS